MKQLNENDEYLVPPHRSELFRLYIERRHITGKIKKFKLVAWNSGIFRFVKKNSNDEYLLLTNVFIFDDKNESIYLEHLHIRVSIRKKQLFESIVNCYVQMQGHPILYTRKNGTRDFTFGGLVPKSIKKYK